MSHRYTNRTTLFGLLIALVVGVAVPATLGSATAGASVLRPGCVWQNEETALQRCTVHSEAMQRDIPVDVQAASNGGSGGLIFFDGGWAAAESNDFVIRAHADNSFKDTNYTKVYMLGGRMSFYSDWVGPAVSDNGTEIYKWETFVTKELRPYLKANFGVAEDHYGAVGISMGGTAALFYAERYPEMFKHVSALSPYTDMTSLFMQCFGPSLLSRIQNFDTTQMWGGFGTEEAFAHDPLRNSGKLKGTSVFLSAATGVDTIFIWDIIVAIYITVIGKTSGNLLEAMSNVQTHALELKMRLEGQNPITYYQPKGLHDWPIWVDALSVAKPHIDQALES